jgi:DNA-binding beta-propeller fold protein YncE
MGLLIGIAATGGPGTSPASASARPLAAPSCSTAVAPAPARTDAHPILLSGPVVPFGVAISANSRTVYVADSTGAIYLYRLGPSGLVSTRVDSFRTSGDAAGSPQAPGLSPIGLALTPDGHYLLAADNSGADLFNVHQLAQPGTTLALWHTGSFTTPSGSGAIQVALSPDGAYAFVTLEDSNDLAVFNLKAALRHGFGPADFIGTVPLGLAPVGMAVSPDGRYLYATSEEAKGSAAPGTLTTIDIATAERDPAHAVRSTVPAGCSPVRVVATRHSVFVTARESDLVLRFDAGDLLTDPPAALQADVAVGEAPVGLALIDHDRGLVVADSNRFHAPGATSNLAVVTIGGSGRLHLAGYVTAGDFPRDMASSPNGQWVVVSNYGSSQVEAVRVSNLP